MRHCLCKRTLSCTVLCLIHSCKANCMLFTLAIFILSASVKSLLIWYGKIPLVHLLMMVIGGVTYCLSIALAPRPCSTPSSQAVSFLTIGSVMLAALASSSSLIGGPATSALPKLRASRNCGRLKKRDAGITQANLVLYYRGSFMWDYFWNSQVNSYLCVVVNLFLRSHKRYGC